MKNSSDDTVKRKRIRGEALAERQSAAGACAAQTRSRAERLKILHLAPHCDENGNGVVNVAIDLAYLQAKDGHNVVFASPEGSFINLLTSYSVSKLPRYSKYSIPQLLFKLRNLLSTFRPDIVHAHMVPGALLARLLKTGLSFGLITSLHNGPRFRTLVMGVGDLIISVSDAVARKMRQSGVPGHKLRVVRNGPLGSPRRGAWGDDQAGDLLCNPAIVTVAGLFSHKGIRDLIEAFALIAAIVPATKLYVIGDGPEKPSLEKAAAQTQFADRIIFCGFVQEPRPYLKSADLFVLPSHREAFGLVLAEARELGCAIVASEVGGIPEALDGGAAGVLVPPRRPIVLANVMLELLQNAEQRGYGVPERAQTSNGSIFRECSKRRWRFTENA